MIPELSLRYSSNRLRDKRRGRAKVDRTREEEKGKKNKEEGEERRWGGRVAEKERGGEKEQTKGGENTRRVRPGGQEGDVRLAIISSFSKINLTFSKDFFAFFRKN